MINRKSFFITLFLLLILQACSFGPYTTSRKDPDLDHECKRIETVAIIPPEVSVQLQVFTGDDEILFKEEQRVKKQLEYQARELLIEHGFTVKYFDFQSAMKKDSELAFAMNQIFKNLQEMGKQYNVGKLAPVEDALLPNWSVGPEINLLSESADVDSLLFMHYKGFRRSKGLRAKDIASLVISTAIFGVSFLPHSEYGILYMAFVDGESGEVLWANLTGDAALNADVVDRCGRDFPFDR